MPIVITGINSDIDESSESVIKKALNQAGFLFDDVKTAEIHKTSLDARKKSEIHFVHSVYVELGDVKTEKRICEKIIFCQYIESECPGPIISNRHGNGKVAIVGFGPAGLFCALVLSEYGYKPVVFERGESVDERAVSVNSFWNGGMLNINSNVQFGEGGAGTFSDGKLTTRIKDPFCRYVLKRFVEFGAPDEILTKAKPHIGTDNLRCVIKSIRNRIIENGGEIHFKTCVNNLNITDGKIKSIKTGKGNFTTSAVVLAIGNSSRDTFEMLYKNKIMMQTKPFSVGVRIEHLQDDVNESLYGKYKNNPFLPAGEYQLSYRQNDERAVYTFCMCPGGVVVPSSSEENGVVTNGMSEFSRNGKNANSAIAVSVSEKDFGSSPLDGMNFARMLEQKAFEIAGENYKAPATTVGGYLNKTPNLQTDLIPTYSRGLSECDFNSLFPVCINEMLEKGINNFSRKMHCFNNKNAVMTAPETRTSSPLRIIRNENMTSLSLSNLYPCGEGAGYAGGIMSAAVDGIKAAYKIMEQYAPALK